MKSLMQNHKDFQRELSIIFIESHEQKKSYIDIKSGDLHRKVGEYRGSNHRMLLSCHVMRINMRSGDKILQEPLSGQGATLCIRYNLLR